MDDRNTTRKDDTAVRLDLQERGFQPLWTYRGDQRRVEIWEKRPGEAAGGSVRKTQCGLERLTGGDHE
jgi:hypothetical protein